MIRWGMTHATQREQRTIGRVLGSLMDAGVEDVRVFSDDGRYGCKMNYHRAFSTMTSEANSWDFIAIIQDDMVPCKQLIETVNSRPRQSASLFTPHHNVRHCPDDNGWVDLNPGWGGWGTQFLLPVEVCREVLAHPFYIEHLHNELDQRHTDACMWEVLQRMGERVVTHIPSLFDHIGETSTIGNTHGEQTRGHRFGEWN